MPVELDAIIAYGIPIVVWLLMLAVGSDVQLAELKRLAIRPRVLFVTSLAQFLVLPLLAGALIVLVRPAEAITAGLILVAASPGGALSNFYCYLARANTSLSVLLTLATTLLALPLTPLLAAAGIRWALAGEVDHSGLELRILSQLLFMLLLPVCIGMAVRHFKPGWIDRLGQAPRLAGLVGVLVIVALIFYSQPGLSEQRVWSIVRAAVLFTLVSLAAGWLVARLLGMRGADSLVVQIEFSVRNLPIATLIAVSVLSNPEFALFASVFLLVQFPLVMALVGIRWRSAPG